MFNLSLKYLQDLLFRTMCVLVRDGVVREVSDKTILKTRISTQLFIAIKAQNYIVLLSYYEELRTILNQL